MLLGDGELIADGPAAEVLSGGWYFATEVARILGGGAITPERGAARSLRGGRAPEPRSGRDDAGSSRRSRCSAWSWSAGFAWYERSRPPPAVVALVAALAALAVAGRLVLAPIPNVVATTDIVADHRLRARRRARLRGRGAGRAGLQPLARPGAVDAVADGGLGPGRPRRRGARGRYPAAASAASGSPPPAASPGFAYGALLDLSVMVTYGGEQSLDRYLAISARGVPFNVAHAAGNVALALAAGPALVRMISATAAGSSSPGRAPARPGAGGAAGGRRCLLVALLSRPASRCRPRRGRGRRRRRRRAAGSSAPRTPTAASAPPRARPRAPAITGWAMLGPRGGRAQPARRSTRRRDADRLPARDAGAMRSTGDLERTILALAAPGVDPRRFGAATWWPSCATARRRRLLRGPGEPDRVRDPRPARRRRRRRDARRSAAWLREAQNGDGGWGFQPRARATPDSTGAALQGLAAAGGGAGDARGASYLRARPARQTAASRSPTAAPINSQSTAWAIQGLVAAGVEPAARPQRTAARRSTTSPPAGRRRPLPLLVLERPDAGLGHRAGAARRQRAGLPARRRPRAEPAPSRRGAGPGGRAARPRTAPAERRLGGRRGRRGQRRGGAAGGAGAAAPAAGRAPPARRAGPTPAAASRERPRDDGERGEADRRPAGRLRRCGRSGSPPALAGRLAPAALGWPLHRYRRRPGASQPRRYRSARWTSRPRSAPGAPTRPSGPTR